MKTNGSAAVRHSVHDLQSRGGYESTATLRRLFPFRWRLMIAVYGSKSRPPLICQSQPKSIHLQHFTVSFTRWELNADFVITFAMLCRLFNQSWQFFFFFFFFVPETMILCFQSDLQRMDPLEPPGCPSFYISCEIPQNLLNMLAQTCQYFGNPWLLLYLNNL